MADLNCEVHIRATQQSGAGGGSGTTAPGGASGGASGAGDADYASRLTVGDHFVLTCHRTSEGTSLADLDLKTLELRLDRKDKYRLHLFQGEKKGNDDIQLDVTSYILGSNQITSAQLVDAQHSWALGEISFTVASVQDPKNIKKTPYGPIEPFRVFPWAFFGFLVFFIFISILPLGISAWRRRQRRKWMAEIDLRSFQYPPFQELHRILRQTQRKYPFLSDPLLPVQQISDFPTALQIIDEAFRTYLTRQFRIPALHWSVSKLCNSLKREQPQLGEEIFHELELVLVEIRRISRLKAEAMEAKDLHQIIQMIRKTSEGLAAQGLGGTS